MNENTPQKFDEIITELQHRTPFHSFVVIMSSGDRYQIDDPFSMVSFRSELFIADARTGMIMRLRKSEIVGLEQLAQKPAA